MRKIRISEATFGAVGRTTPPVQTGPGLRQPPQTNQRRD